MSARTSAPVQFSNHAMGSATPSALSCISNLASVEVARRPSRWNLRAIDVTRSSGRARNRGRGG